MYKKLITLNHISIILILQELCEFYADENIEHYLLSVEVTPEQITLRGQHKYNKLFSNYAYTIAFVTKRDDIFIVKAKSNNNFDDVKGTLAALIRKNTITKLLHE